MKTIALVTAALTAFAPAAFAYDGSHLTPAETFDARQYVPSGDFSNLTPAQASAISNALHSGDGSDTGSQIYSILNW